MAIVALGIGGGGSVVWYQAQAQQAPTASNSSATAEPVGVRADGPATTISTTTTTAVPELERIDVSVEYEILTEDYTCVALVDMGYDDIIGGEAELRDGQGNLLGFGTLGEGIDTDTTCHFDVSFGAAGSTDGLYQISVGSDVRGQLSYSADDVVNGHLLAEIEVDGPSPTTDTEWDDAYTDADHSQAETVWLDTPAGSDLCWEWVDDSVTIDELEWAVENDSVYVGIDPDAVFAVLDANC